MQRHPYRPANKRGMVIRIRTTQDSVDLGPHKDRGPCLFVEGGVACGQAERQIIHAQPFHHKYAIKTRELPALKGAGKDTPIY